MRRDKINYYLDICEQVLERGTCLRRNFGAIIVNNDEIVLKQENELIKISLKDIALIKTTFEW